MPPAARATLMTKCIDCHSNQTHAPIYGHLAPVSWLMEQTLTALVDAFEMITVHMCSKNIQPLAGLPLIIQPLSPKYKEAWRVRFAYGMYYQDGEFVPCG